ncbi:MAG: NAD(P)-dependent oxidoreductase, partial [Stellaceae bacterium]
MSGFKKKHSLLVVCPLPEGVKADFRAAFDARFYDAVPEDDLNAALGTREFLVLSFGTLLTPRRIQALPPTLRAIATYSVGFEHIDIAAAKARSLPVFNTPDVLTDAVAEIGLFLMLGAARRASESIDLIRGRRWTGWSPTQLIGTELTGKTLGILGMGRIGRGIAQRARAFGMAIHYHNRHRLPPELEGDAEYHADFAAMAGVSDAVMIAAHSHAETRRYLDAGRIAQLKPGAIVCNIARGELIDDDALIAA